MCYSLPVIGKDDQDIFADEYTYLRDGEDHAYDQEACAQNYENFPEEPHPQTFALTDELNRFIFNKTVRA